jgi:hypothetical protein
MILATFFGVVIGTMFGVTKVSTLDRVFTGGAIGVPA